jgi:2-oxoisovalerate dehydrogenase E1 component
MRGVESMAPLTLNAAIKKTLESELKNNPKMLIFGQDVAVMGGLYGTTTSLHARFGSDRVFDTSLSEDGIVGRSIGMAFAGLLPVSEIQCRKYADAGTEHINNAGTIRWRTAGRFAAPMVIRIPCGVGKLTGDPWHAVTSESIFAHNIGLRVAFPSNAEDAVGLLRSALRGNDPTIFLEHRALLYHPGARRYYPGDEHVVPFGMARTIQRGSELTIVTWGEAVYRVLGASENFWERVEVIDLRSIMPWDKQHVLDSVRKTHKCLIVHEDNLTCGFGAEIAATIAQEAFMDLEAPVIRLAASDQPVPYNQNLMAALSPSTDSVKREIENLLDY